MQGPAQGFHVGAMTNEDAQRLAQIGAKQPLLSYLAQLQKTLPSQPSAAPDAAPAKGFYLPNLKQTMPQGSLSRADESTIDLQKRDPEEDGYLLREEQRRQQERDRRRREADDDPEAHLAVPGTELNADNTVPVAPLMEDQPRQGLWVDIEI